MARIYTYVYIMPQKITLCATFPLFGHAPYCAKCAAERVPELPICDWQQIVALSPPGTKRKSEWRKYKVHSLNEPSNRAILVIIDGSNQFLCGQTRIVRSDALSPTSRAIDAAFQIGGTALEIRFFENSDQR